MCRVTFMKFLFKYISNKPRKMKNYVQFLKTNKKNSTIKINK